MDLRDFFAAKAMPMIAARFAGNNVVNNFVAEESYKLADEMMVARESKYKATTTIHELRNESGEVIHACATASFPLPKDHWIYAEPVEPEPTSGITSKDQLREKIREAIRYAIQVCTSNGKDMDFDPDAMCMGVDHVLFRDKETPVSECPY